MQMVAGRYAGMTDIADMPTYAYIALSSHAICSSVHTTWKSRPRAGFRCTSRNCCYTWLQRLSRFLKHRPACHRVRQDPLRHGVSFSFHRMHPYTETGRNGIPPPTFIQWIQNRIIGQYGNRQPAVSYERLSLPGRVDTVDDSTESGFISL